MARLIDAVRGAVLPERRMIVVLGGTGGGTLEPDFTQNRLCYAGHDELILMSDTRWPLSSTVRLEAWDAEPPARPNVDATETTTMELSQGTVVLTMMGESEHSPVLAAGPPGNYSVRVEVSGRAEPDGTGERFRVCFWAPAAARVSAAPVP